MPNKYWPAAIHSPAHDLILRVTGKDDLRKAVRQAGEQPAKHEQSRRRRLPLLCITALGVVYGDIGTSPLYAFRQCFHGAETGHHLVVNPANVLGILSLVTWSLLIIISIKYLVYVMRADNKGEGGILALLALMERRGSKAFWFVSLSIFGAALLYGDGMITPAISVLSAVEGLKIATPIFNRFPVPITVAILVLLFLFQRRGTKTVGLVFGPVMLLWFLTIGVLGLRVLVSQPVVLVALNPVYAIHFFQLNGWLGFAILGAVFLVATGGEALYADLGHFGRRAIRTAWFGLVLPTLLLNYLGQGALLLSNAKAAEHPFFQLAPSWALYPLVVLATCAAVIASQAIISGVFSLTRQAVLLDELPRLQVIQTSEEEIGQVYVPAINWLLMIACVGLVFFFRTSSNLAAAYGVAVSMTMVITTILLAKIARKLWKWNPWLIGSITAAFLIVDLAFVSANLLKFTDGGWFPLAVGGILLAIMTTWRHGRELLWRRLHKMEKPLADFLNSIAHKPPARVPGTSIFLTGRVHGTPAVLMHHVKHNKVLSEEVILLDVQVADIPHVPPDERCACELHTQGFCRALLKFGFMDELDVPKAIRALKGQEKELDLDQVTYYIGRQTPIPTIKSVGMAPWRERLFAFMARSATHAVDFFKLPPQQVVELGLEVEV